MLIKEIELLRFSNQVLQKEKSSLEEETSLLKKKVNILEEIRKQCLTGEEYQIRVEAFEKEQAVKRLEFKQEIREMVQEFIDTHQK